MVEFDKEIIAAMQAGTPVSRVWSVAKFSSEGKQKGPAVTFYRDTDAREFAAQCRARGEQIKAWANYSMTLEW